MMVDEPVYRVTWGASPAVITGKDGVLAFYNSVGESVLWHSDDRLSVADWGICDELTFHQLARGADLRAVGYDVDDADALYHASSRQAFIWPYDEPGAPRRRASLRGQDEPRDRRGEPGRGDHAGAGPRDPPGAARKARSGAGRPLLGLHGRVTAG